MTYDQLRSVLAGLSMFSDAEVDAIVQACGTATMGNAVIACEVLGIELAGSDIDEMFAALA